MQSLLKKIESNGQRYPHIMFLLDNLTFERKDSCPQHQESRSCMTSSQVQRARRVSGTLDETLEIRGGIWSWVACRSMVVRVADGLGWAGSISVVCYVAMDFILQQCW